MKMTKLFLTLFIMALLSIDLYAEDRGDCTPNFEGTITDSKILLNCSKKLPIGVKLKLEELLNEQFTGNEDGECSPHFREQIKETTITIQCGYPIEHIQTMINDFLIMFTSLKNKLANLEVTSANTEKLQKEASQAINAGDFDKAQALIDEIIGAEESVGRIVIEEIKALREIHKNAQQNKAQAERDYGVVMVELFKCEEAMNYFLMADKSIEQLNALSEKTSSKQVIDNSEQEKMIERCLNAQIFQ